MFEDQDLIGLRREFDKARKSVVVLEQVIKNFCELFLIDNRNRPLKLRPMQIEIVRKCFMNRHVMLLAPRGSGKSKALSVAATMWLYFYRSGEKVGIIAPQMKQARLIFDDILDNFLRSPILSRMGILKNHRTENNPIIVMDGGSFAIPFPAETKREGQSVRGFHATFCIVDESPMIPDNLFEANIEPIVMAHRAPFINIGTPKNKDNHSYRYMYSDKYGHFERLKYDYKDALVVGDAYETPWDPKDIEIKKDTWGEDSIEFRTEYMCEFIESSGQFFTSDTFANSLYKIDKFARNSKNLPGRLAMTMDIADSHNSIVYALWETVIEDDEDILYLRDVHEIRPPRAGIEPARLRTVVLDYAAFYGATELVMDATGAGKIMFRDLKTDVRNRGMQFKIRPFFFSRNKGEQYSEYKLKLRSGRIRLPRPDSLQKRGEGRMMDKALEQHYNISYSFSKDMKSFLIAPAKHRHDDFPDCFCMSPLLLGRKKHNPRVLGANRNKEYRPKSSRVPMSVKTIPNDEFSRQKYAGRL